MDYKPDTDHIWDVVVIGMGMGGGATGYALAKAGMSVLFLEKGCDTSNTEKVNAGMFAENSWQGIREPENIRPALRQNGRYWQDVEDISSDKPHRFIPFIGCGTGGSSRIYGAALERLARIDFHPKQNFPHDNDADLPDSWPFTYDELLPYYMRAESILEVRGTTDGLRADETFQYLEPGPLSAAGLELFNYFQGKGLHPYRLPVGLKTGTSCTGCQSMICIYNCKMDSFTACIKPAVMDYQATTLHECEVVRLTAREDKVETAECVIDGKSVSIKGRIFILAAGALESPRILLNSCSDSYPNGLGNQNDLVGRFLMRHFIDLIAIKPHKPSGLQKYNLKEIALNDFYNGPEGKLGTFQSFGNFPPAEIITKEILLPLYLKGRLGEYCSAVLTPLLDMVLSRLFKDRYFMAFIMEDLPYRDNRVTVRHDAKNPAGMLQISYRIRHSEQERIDSYRHLLRTVLRGYKFIWIKSAEQNKRIAHAAGTLRAGKDPATSVINADCLVHSISNLYVTDASFFPSSGGTNPGLTIAANGLRVADKIIACKK